MTSPQGIQPFHPSRQIHLLKHQNPLYPFTMISASTLAAILALGQGVLGQQAGTSTAEVHPSMSYQKCTSSGQCTTVNTQIVLDANWRWLHSTSGYTNCYTGNTFDTSLCPDNVACAANCALDGAGMLIQISARPLADSGVLTDYTGTYGIQASGNSVSLKLKQGNNVGSRVYLLNGDKYEIFKLKNNEFTFDVDVSQLGESRPDDSQEAQGKWLILVHKDAVSMVPSTLSRWTPMAVLQSIRQTKLAQSMAPATATPNAPETSSSLPAR